MDAPKMSSKVKQEKRASYRAAKTGVPAPKPVDEKPQPQSQPPQPVPEALKKMYVNIKDPDDHAALTALKQACKAHPGAMEIILVLGGERKSAIRLPFRVEDSDVLMGKLVRSIGEDAVVIK